MLFKRTNILVIISFCFFISCKIQVEQKTNENTTLPESIDLSAVEYPTTPKKEYTQYVTYEEYGAKGDGVTDDMQAIIDTHNYANANNLPVKATPGAKYLMKNPNSTYATIKTDCDWTGAEFIIDDSDLSSPNQRNQIFYISPSKREYAIIDEELANGNSYKGKIPELKQHKIKKTDKNLGVSLDEQSLVWLEDKNIKRFKRNQDSGVTDGNAQEDIIIVNQDGSINSGTPLNWNYDSLTAAHAIPIDKETLYITGGTFTTIVNKCTPVIYVKGGIWIARSNVVIDGLNHILLDEGTPSDYSSPYYGIFYIKRCAYITIKNCKVSSHITYANRCGTYDFYPYEVAHLTLENCSEYTDLIDNTRWGVFGSNYCKAVILDNCSLSRFDAHQGVTNALIKNSTIGHAGINLTGEGNFTIENSKCYGGNFINLRRDYGSTWHGNIYIKNCEWVPRAGLEPFSSSMACIFGGNHIYNYDFGYDCYMPTALYIDGFIIDDTNNKPGYKGPYLLSEFIPIKENAEFENYRKTYPYHLIEDIYIRGFVSKTGIVSSYYGISVNEELFKDVKIHSEW